MAKGNGLLKPMDLSSQASRIAEILDELPFAHQLPCLVGVLLSAVLANGGPQGDELIATIAAVLPQQWRTAQLMMVMHDADEE